MLALAFISSRRGAFSNAEDMEVMILVAEVVVLPTTILSMRIFREGNVERGQEIEMAVRVMMNRSVGCIDTGRFWMKFVMKALIKGSFWDPAIEGRRLLRGVLCGGFEGIRSAFRRARSRVSSGMLGSRRCESSTGGGRVMSGSSWLCRAWTLLRLWGAGEGRGLEKAEGGKGERGRGVAL